jgi:hypothetical protein
MPAKPKRLPPLFSYYGSKWRMAPRYPEPKYDTIIEPFAGSAQYATLYPDRNVILCDLNKRICETWRWLIDATPADVLSLPLIADGESVLDHDLPAGAANLIGYWLNQASVEPKPRGSSRARGSHAKHHWGDRVRGRLASCVGSVSHWEIRNCSYSDLRHEMPATYFIDPPYQGAPGRHYTHSDVNYRQLADWCKNRAGQVIACENVGAEWLPFIPLHTGRTASPTKRPPRHEAVWLSPTTD